MFLDFEKNVKTFFKRTYSFRGYLFTPVSNTQLPKVSTGKSPTSNIFAQKCGRRVYIRKKGQETTQLRTVRDKCL